MKRSDFENTRIEQVAADWFVRRRDGLAPEVETRFQSWLAADPRHKAAFAEFESTWNIVSTAARTSLGDETPRRLRRATASRRRFYTIAVASLSAAAAAWFLVSAPEPTSVTTTQTGAMAMRPKIDRLPDGSLAELDAEGEIAVEFTSSLRSIRLIKGRGRFTVSKDPARPFVVTAGSVSVRAVGTVFAVRFTSNEVGVVVSEGRVAVVDDEPLRAASTIHGQHSTVPVLLDAGQGALVAVKAGNASVSSIQPMPAGQIADALAWLGKRVEFTHLPLSAAVDFFNRQNSVRLSISDPALASLPISGIFWSDDPEAFVRLLESGMGVLAHRTGDKITLSQR